MSTKIGHFEILSELAKSPTGAVYKANDPESGQTIALKAIQLSAFGESADGARTGAVGRGRAHQGSEQPQHHERVRRGRNRRPVLRRHGVHTGQQHCHDAGAQRRIFDLGSSRHRTAACAAASIMPSRTTSFTTAWSPPRSCAAGTAPSRFSGSAYPAWATFVQHVAEGVPSILHYMSPEQVRGEATDSRSNLFSLGAMFYEMVTERKAFDREDVESLRQSILESTPVPPLPRESQGASSVSAT